MDLSADDQRQDYLKRRDELLKLRQSSVESFDKTVLALSTGGIALSVTFLEKIGRPFDFVSFALITAYWASCLIVVTLTLFSFYFAEQNMTLKITDLDVRYGKGTLYTEPEQAFPQRMKTVLCNAISRSVFAVGILLFMGYVLMVQHKNFQNLSR